MKIHKRITAGVLAAALCATLPGMDSFRVLAGQEEEGKFTTKNLIVSTADENFDTLGAGECLNLGEGLYALSYADEKSTESAYKAYRGMEGIDFVDINSVVSIQTEEKKKETEDASLTENSQEDVSDQKEDSIKTKEEETEEHPEPEEETGNQKELQKEEEISPEEPDTEQEETKAASDTEQEEADIKEAEQEDDILRVALLDTGVKADTGNLVSYIEDTGVNLTDSGDAGSTVDDNGHGTAMAQVMVSALEENGKNSDNVKILPVKVLDASGCGTTFSAYQGVKAAIGQGADIICLGFSGKAESILLEQAVNDAYETGITVLAPAGNDGEDILAYVPGCYDNAVVIGSAKNKKEADESNHGDTVDFAAYGTKEVLSLTGELQTVKGTSVSCAYVTGVAASFPKGLSCEEMETELVKKAVPAEDEGLKPYFGKGLIGEVPEAVQETAVEEETAEKDEETAAEAEETAEAAEAEAEETEEAEAEETEEAEEETEEAEEETEEETIEKDTAKKTGKKTTGDALTKVTRTYGAAATTVGTYQTDSFGDAYSQGYIRNRTSDDVIRKSSGVNPKKGQEINTGLSSTSIYYNKEYYTGTNTSKSAYIDYRDAARYVDGSGDPVWLDMRVYVSTNNSNYPWAITTDKLTVLHLFSSAVQKTTLEFHFYQAGTLETNHPIEVSFKGVLGITDIDTCEGVLFYSGYHKFYKTADSRVSYVAKGSNNSGNANNPFNRNTSTTASNPYFFGTVLSDNTHTVSNPDKQKLWVEIDSSSTSPFKYAYGTRNASRNSGLYYTGTAIEYYINGNIKDTFYCVPYGKYSLVNISKIGDPVGHTLDGWYTSTTYTTRASGGKAGTQTIKVYGKSTVHQSKVFYNANGGAMSESDGIHSDNSKYYKLNSSGDVTSSDTKNGTKTKVTKIVNYTSEASDPANVGTFGIKKAGYHVDSQKEWKDGNGTIYDQATKYAPSGYFPNIGTKTGESKTLYVNWKVNQSAVSYNANGGTMSESDGIHSSNSKYYKLDSNGDVTSSDTKNGTKTKVTKTVNYTSEASNPADVGTFGITKAGYHVDSKKEWKDGNGTIYDQATNYAPSGYFPNIGTKTGESKTLYVNWAENQSAVFYNANGGTITESDGIHFGNSKYFKLDSNDYVTSSDTKNGTKTYHTKTVKYTSEASDPANVGTFGITKRGYHVDSKKEWKDGNGTIYDQATEYAKTGYFPNIATKTGESKTLYVNWKANTYTVKYDGNGSTGGSTADSTHTYDTAGKLTANGFKRQFSAAFYDNYSDDDPQKKTVSATFKSWNTIANAANGSGTAYSDQQSVTNLTATDKGTVNLYAQWQDGTVTLPSITREGYDLSGWNTSKSEADAGKIKDGYTPGAKVTVASDTNFYAVWKLKTYTITYNANGGTGTMEPGIKTYFDTYTIKKNAFIRSGYDFVGWSRTKEGPADPDYAEGEEYNTNADLTLYAQWRENFHPDYIGNEQTEGNDFIDEGKDGYGYSEDKDYSLNNEEEHFKKEETVTYKDSETGELVMQTVEGTVTGWSYKKNKEERNDENTYELGTVVHGTEFMKKALDYGAVSYGGPNEDFGTYPKNVLAEGVKTTYGAQQGAVLQNLGVGTVYNGTPYVNLYADWDMGPVIEAYDRYYTLEEAQGGIITEDELLNAAKATDEELKSSTNPDGKLKNHEDAENGTSFVVYDYQAEEFTELNGSAVISVTYRAEDAAGNVTRKMIMVHIVDGHDTIIDGHDIGVDPDEGEVRFISEDYLDTLDADSVWVNNPEYAALLEETVKIKRVDPERSEAPEALKAFGDKYTVAIPGTGTWTKEPKYVWNFTHEQTQEVKDFIEEHGPSNFVEEDALKTFLNEFADCMEQ